VRSVGDTQAVDRYIAGPARRKGGQLMELEQIEALTDLSRLSKVDLFNLLGRTEELRRSSRLKGKDGGQRARVRHAMKRILVSSELRSLDLLEHGR
jgi:hypothetical protein